MSVGVHVAPEFFGEQYLRLARDNWLAGSDTRGQDPPISFPAQEAHFAALIAAGSDAHIDQGTPLME
jgi:hypothetical protein